MKKLFQATCFCLLLASIILLTAQHIQEARTQDLVRGYRRLNVLVEYEYHQAIVEPSFDLMNPGSNLNLSKNPSAGEMSLTLKGNKEKELFDTIKNYVGWIRIDQTQIDYPLVRGKDNDFYLNHGYDMKANTAGAIFMDRRNLGNTFDQHTIIYGHHMSNGSMFTDLNKYLDESFFYENTSIYFRDLFNDSVYEVFSAYYVSADDYQLPYSLTQTNVENFISRSLYKTDYSYKAQDRILTLSTCNYLLNNGRMIVHAVLLQ